jgi:hypothetical protein
MRHYLLALGLAAASLALTATGHADTGYASLSSQQSCTTKRVQALDQHGKAISKRVRICQ